MILNEFWTTGGLVIAEMQSILYIVRKHQEKSWTKFINVNEDIGGPLNWGLFNVAQVILFFLYCYVCERILAVIANCTAIK